MFLREHEHRRFPVVEDGKFVGVITRKDVLRALRDLLPGFEVVEGRIGAGAMRSKPAPIASRRGACAGMAGLTLDAPLALCAAALRSAQHSGSERLPAPLLPLSLSGHNGERTERSIAMLKIQAAVCDVLKGLVRREEGVTAIEYGLIAALIAVVKRSMQTRSVLRLSPLLVALALGVVPVLFASTQGCSSTPDDATGSAELIATTAQELTSADVTRVTITITGAGIATPITHDLVRVSGQWRGTLGAIPVGTGRNFHGDAFDAAGAVVYRGDVPSVTITKGATALVALLMQQVQAPTPFHNSAPRIDSTTASSNAVAPGDVVMLAATAHDPDGDALTIAWSTTGGTFTDPSTLTPQWTAPATEGSYDLTVRATDPKGAVAAMTFAVNVAASNGRGNADVTTTLNTWPEVALVNASPTRIDVGESTTLSIVASDADSDALHYAWTATCAGSFDNAASQAPTFTLAAPLPAGNACALVATVTDGRGGTNTGQISISTGPGPTPNIAPQVDRTFQSSTTSIPGEPVTLRVQAHDPEGSAVTFAWSAPAGALTGLTTTNGASEVQWTMDAPCRNGTVDAIITDGSGLSTKHTFAIGCALGAMVATANSMTVPRIKFYEGPNSAVHLLGTGKVLLAGGGTNYFSNVVDLYDPATRRFTPTGSMSVGRCYGCASALLGNGKVLVSGGWAGGGVFSSAELYDPATGTFSPSGGTTVFPRLGAFTTVLQNGSVLLVGGHNGYVGTPFGETYDPVTDRFTQTTGQVAGVSGSMVTLASGNAFVMTRGTPPTAQQYDPNNGTFSFAATSLTSGFDGVLNAFLLPSGKVFVPGDLEPSEIYDPATGFSLTSAPRLPRTDHVSVALSDGRVLLAGGIDSANQAVLPCEVYDPATNTFTIVASLSTARRSPILTRLPNGDVLIAGGNTATGNIPLASAEVFSPPPK